MSTLEQLEKLKLERSPSFPFPSIIDLEKWADEVAPLLAFSKSYSFPFHRAISNAKSTYRMGSMKDALTNVNEAIGIVNQALIFLKNDLGNKIDQDQAKEELKYPEKVTFSWLLKHVEIKHWFIALSVLFSAFSAGIVVGQSNFYKTLLTLL